MISSAKLEVQLLVDACVRGGISNIVLSPGSRNAPLSIAFDEHPEIKTFVVADERAAAFYALGMAQQLQQPVAIACTSGSAPLNYFPAVAEAYYQGVPLVIITADRPQEWVDQGDGQTIVQQNVYGSHVLASAQLGVIHSEAQRWLFERQCAEVIQKANGRHQGPVHLNISFNEPLYETTGSPERLSKWIHVAEGELSLSETEKLFLSAKWKAAKRKMVICGQLVKSENLRASLEKLSADPSVAILVEHTSNLQHGNFVQCIDRSLNLIPEDKIAEFQPDLLVVLGGAVVSKRIKAFLRNSPGLETIRAGNDFPFMDTFRSMIFTTSVKASHLVDFLGEIPPSIPSSFGRNWKALDSDSGKAHDDFLGNCRFSDLKAMETIWKYLPGTSHIHISNSSIIRYALLFDPKEDQVYWCNRGTSGIDGSSSTACGAAIANPETHTLITGDMSFFYDSNAFWSAHKPANLRVIVLNNGGGDIFNIIPGPSSVPQRGQYFVAEQQYSAEHICKAYGLDYQSADSVEEIESALKDFYSPHQEGKIRLLEINTSGLGNSDVLKEYWNSK